MHSTYSDGNDSLAQIVEGAAVLGYRYIGISEHSQSAFYARGLNEDELRRQHDEIDTLQQRHRGIRILKGVESDILADGSLDFPRSVLEQLDFVIASVHSRFNMDREAMTERIVRAVRNPQTTILGHPTGRLLLSREPYAVDIDRVIEAAVSNRVALEINAYPNRLDLNWRMVRDAAERGAMFCIDPDAHDVAGLSAMRLGVAVARKAWLSPEQVLNTRTADEFLRFSRRR